MSKETLSEETKRMCRMCARENHNDGGCNLLNQTKTKQNELAQKGLCNDAAIEGISVDNTNWTKIGGIMQKHPDGQWIFIGNATKMNI